MDSASYEQYELSKEQVDDNWKVPQGRHALLDDAVNGIPSDVARTHGLWSIL